MTKQMKVGLFLALGLLILSVSVFMLGSNKSYFQNSYTLHSYFDNVQGLNRGGIVSLAGVKVGNIQNIEFDDQKNLVRVDYLVEEDLAHKIKTDSRIELRTQGALGDKFLYIIPGTASEKIQNGAELKSEFGNDILAILNKRGSESEKIFDTISDLNKLVKSLTDQNKLPSLIFKLDQAAGNLNEASGKVKSALQTGHLETSLTKLDHILEKIDNGQGTLGALINDRSLHDKLKSIFGVGQKQQQVKSILKNSVEENQ